MCCMWLTGNAGPKKLPKIGHLGTIAQLCQAISSQPRQVSPIRKKVVKQQYLPHMSSQYGDLLPANGWDLFGSLGHPNKFHRVSLLGSVTAMHSSIGRWTDGATYIRQAAITFGIGAHCRFNFVFTGIPVCLFFQASFRWSIFPILTWQSLSQLLISNYDY